MMETIAKVNIKSCARCGESIEKGSPVERWVDGPKTGAALRLVHVGCVASAPAAALDADTVREMIVEQLGGMLEELDLSGLESEVSEVIETRLVDQENKVESRLGEFCQKMAEATSEATTQFLQVAEQMIKAGIPVVHTIKKWDGSTKKIDGHVHPLFSELLVDVNVRDDEGNRYPAFIAGPAGCGKTKLAEQIANALDLPFYFISCSAGMSESQLTGRLTPAPLTAEQMKAAVDGYFSMGFTKIEAATLANASGGGSFSYQIAPFVKAYENGGVFLLDEVDAADANVLLVINAALAGNKMAVPNRPESPFAKRHPDFICIAAANTFGRGADRQYVGRTRLDGAFLDRFSFFAMDYDTDLEARLCPDAELLAAMHEVRENCAANRIERPVSTRQIVKLHHFRSQAGYTVAQCVEKFMRGWSKDEITKATR